MRASRIGALNETCYLLTETQLESIFKHAEELQPTMLVIDSIQTIHTETIESSPGSISQIRESTAQLLRFAKQTETPVFLIGHITKEGSLAGPKVLEHMVDTVLQFEGDRNHVYRLLRSIKNRFGSTNELGIYEMLGTGLRQVENPSEILISKKDIDFSEYLDPYYETQKKNELANTIGALICERAIRLKGVQKFMEIFEKENLESSLKFIDLNLKNLDRELKTELERPQILSLSILDN
jgi:predicted ATP-dependent serine protease